MSQQLTLTLETGIGTRYRSLKECVASGVFQRGVVAVAGKIDRSPSHLSEALSGGERRKFDVDEMEAYIQATGDLTPIHYLVARYLRDPSVGQREALERLAVLADSLPALLRQAGVHGVPNA